MTRRLKPAFWALLISSWATVLVAATPSTAVFAGGCFWCMETAYEGQNGIAEAVSGYAGGSSKNPTYKSVSSGRSGHIEVVEIRYDSDVLSFEDLLDTFWRNVDPFQKNGQFCDRGPQYRTAIFYSNKEEKTAAEQSKRSLEKRFGKKIVTEILPLKEFFPAEDYHQDFYQRNPVRYKFYKWNCGRAQRLEELWGNA